MSNSIVDFPVDGSKFVELSECQDGQGKVLSRAKEVGDISDGYHTFNQLYDYRMIYNALLVNEYAKQGKYNVHKSTRHSDGELCFGGGWFVVSMTLPTGQVTNHYKNEYWDLFVCEGRENADEWDGHTPEEAFDRMLKFAQQENEMQVNRKN